MPESFRLLACAAAALCFALPAQAQEAAIRKAIAERLPEFPKIDEVREAPLKGLYEIRVGTDIFYSDAAGNYLIEGHLIDTRSKANLTEQRVAKLTAIDFAALPLADAIVFKQGTGARKLVFYFVFVEIE